MILGGKGFGVVSGSDGGERRSCHQCWWGGEGVGAGGVRMDLGTNFGRNER